MAQITVQNPDQNTAQNMTPQERHAAGWLASIFALRMLGLFMILPIFALHAKTLPGGDNQTLIGLTMGIYGLSQACLQIPLGWASDKIGRKPVIIAGLLIFCLGSILGACATTVLQLCVARAIQGAGAISAAITAFLADLTREEQRAKAMAIVGGSIGLTFAVSLMGAPVLYDLFGLSGLFAMTGFLSILAIFVVIDRLPSLPPHPSVAALSNVSGRAIVLKPDLLRLNAGIFILHLTQMALFVVLPGLIVQTTGYTAAQHWKIYLPVVLISFVLMIAPMLWAEKRSQTKLLKLLTVGAMALIQAGFAMASTHMWWLLILLVLYFVAFNLLEAMLPSWVSRVAPPHGKGLALGVYNTTQALGLFSGGALGGLVSKHYGPVAVFECIAGLTLVWWFIAKGLTPLSGRKSVAASDTLSTQSANA